VFWISQGIRRGNTVESQTLRGRETVLVSQTKREVMRMLTENQVGIGCKHKDGEPYTLKGVSTVRRGGHAIPERVNGPYSTRNAKGSGE